MTTPSRAVLIDAYSQIFRVFYAIMHLSRKDGFPTNALFGFARLLMQIEKDYAPTSGAMFFDCGKPAFRLELAPEYKSNRPPMPEDLKKQMPLLRELAELFGWQVCECKNYEADDLIGAAAKNSSQSTAIISSDKDLSQLINENCIMLIPNRSGGGFEVRDAEKTVEKFAVTPAQIVDYLALLGDSSDVIDGVPGIGPKTAANILNECGTLERFFAEPGLLKNEKQRSKLLESQERILRNIKLITLRTQWPEDELGPLSSRLQKNSPDWQKIAEFARTYELKSILKDIPQEFAATAAAGPEAAAVAEKQADSTDDLFNWSDQQNKAAETSEKSEPAGKTAAPQQGTLF